MSALNGQQAEGGAQGLNYTERHRDDTISPCLGGDRKSCIYTWIVWTSFQWFFTFQFSAPQETGSYYVKNS